MRNFKILFMCILLVLCTLFSAGCSRVAKNTDADQMDVRSNGKAIQWKYSSETEWHDLVELDDLKGAAGQNGADGINGKAVQIRNNGDFIQWRYDEGEGWNNLVSVLSLSGANGKDGKDGVDGKNGADGSTVEIRKTDDFIQWRHENGEWQELVSLSDITGPSGKNGSNGADGKTPEFRIDESTLQWRYVGDEIWLNLYNVSLLKGKNGADGKDGTTPELKIGDDNIWYVSYDDGASWNSLGVKATGDKGETGDAGNPGENGKDGVDGKDGICSGYFYAVGGCAPTILHHRKAIPSFTYKLSGGDLVSFSDNTVTLKKGHTYSVCFSGSIGVSTNNDNGNLCVVMTDNYDDKACKDATRIYQYYGGNKERDVPLYQFPIIYNRVYNAKDKDVVLKYSFEQEQFNTVLDSLTFTYTVIALD